MELIRHHDLRLAIGVKLTVARKHASREELLDAIMSTLSGTVIVKPTPIGLHQAHGEFGVTEPHPFPDAATSALSTDEPTFL